MLGAIDNAKPLRFMKGLKRVGTPGSINVRKSKPSECPLNLRDNIIIGLKRDVCSPFLYHM